MIITSGVTTGTGTAVSGCENITFQLSYIQVNEIVSFSGTANLSLTDGGMIQFTLPVPVDSIQAENGTAGNFVELNNPFVGIIEYASQGNLLFSFNNTNESSVVLYFNGHYKSCPTP